MLIAALAPAGAAHAGDPLRGQQWGLSMIESDAAHAVTRGGGAVVAVIDTGVLASHEDLQGRLLAGHDFVSGDDRAKGKMTQYFVGQVMKATRGKADGKAVTAVLRQRAES